MIGAIIGALTAKAALPATIGAAGSLIGGALDRKENRRQAARQEYLRSPAGIRAESEKAGFNPLTVLTSGRELAADSYRPVIGDALANAGFHVSDAIQKEKMRQTELQMHNDNLKARLKALSLKPVPNQYGRTTGTAGSNQYIGGKPTNWITKNPHPDVFTNLGGKVTAEEVDEEAQILRSEMDAIGHAYPWWEEPFGLPPASHVEEGDGDGGGALYGLAKLPFKVGWNGARAFEYITDWRYKKAAMEGFYHQPKPPTPKAERNYGARGVIRSNPKSPW